MSNFAEPGADAFLDGTALPATLYIQWHLGNPGAAGTGNVAAETTRQPFTRTAAVAGSSQASAEIEVSSPVATEVWTHATLWGASSAGVCWMVAAFSTPLPVTAGTPVTVAAADLTITAPIWG